MEEYVAGRLCEYGWALLDSGRSVLRIFLDRDRFLDRWLAVRQSVVCGCPHHVSPAILQSVLFSPDGQDLSRPDDHLPDFYHDSAFEHGLLHPALVLACES